jgi:hypothetical protein
VLACSSGGGLLLQVWLLFLLLLFALATWCYGRLCVLIVLSMVVSAVVSNSASFLL